MDYHQAGKNGRLSVDLILIFKNINGSQQFLLRLAYGRSPHAYVNQRLQIQLELLMMSGVPLETC
jgi:hypothetical protein